MAMFLLMMSANLYINISMHIGLYALLLIFFSRCECGVPDRYPILSLFLVCSMYFGKFTVALGKTLMTIFFVLCHFSNILLDFNLLYCCFIKTIEC